MSTFSTLIQHCTGIPSHSKQKRRRYKGIKIGKENVKLIICRWHGENPKDPTKKILELIKKFTKVPGYKIYNQKSITLLFSNNEVSERAAKKIPFTIALK